MLVEERAPVARQKHTDSPFDTEATWELELELTQTQMTQKQMLRLEVRAHALRNQTVGGGGWGPSEFSSLWERPLSSVPGPQNRKRSQEGIDPPPLRAEPRSLSWRPSKKWIFGLLQLKHGNSMPQPGVRAAQASSHG